MIKIEFIDGTAVISGSFSFGYMGIYKDERIEIYDTIAEIREWEIVENHFDGDFSDEQLTDFLTDYFNAFETKIQANIKQVNDCFLISAYVWAESTKTEFWNVPEITNAEYLPKNITDFDPYTFSEEAWKIMNEYSDTPNDGTVHKTDVEKFLREKIPLLNLDAFLAGIIPECVGLSDGSVSFQCSDSVKNPEYQILCGAYDDLDENLTFCDWHNF